MGDARIPRSTYRLQFSPRFDLAAAVRIVPYLDSLGITDVYASPLLQARTASSHGYDVTDPTRVRQDLGGEAGLEALSRSLRRRGMAVLLDIVPNHMAVSSENPWWMDVLEHGERSAFARFFDIDWHPPQRELDGKVLLPILGDSVEHVLRSGELRLEAGEEGPSFRYYDFRLPLAPGSWRHMLDPALRALRSRFDPSHPAVAELSRLIRRADAAGRQGDGTPRADWVEFRRKRPEGRRQVDAVVRRFNDTAGPRGSEPLETLLEQQHWSPAFWRRAPEEINYRRFFNIGDLVSLRMEDPRVFDAVHETVIGLVRRGRVSGLRVDHVDGLLDPHRYLLRLRSAVGEGTGVWVEKILSGEERLRPGWPVEGTTGYEFLNAVNGLFVDRRGCRRLGRVWTSATGDRRSFEETAYEKKKRVLEMHFLGEFRRLLGELASLASRDATAAAIPNVELARALAEITACLPVYRTYLAPGKIERADRVVLARALREARRRSPGSRRALSFLSRVLVPPGSGAGRRAERARLAFVQRWQQLSGPVTAKGVEDTALYVHTSLVSLNEVGGDPGSDGLTVEGFHRRMRERSRLWPGALSATATHDTKRGEDVRVRIDVLSEMAGEWAELLARWRARNAPLRTRVHGRPVPDPATEILLYQTLLGAWPLGRFDAADFRARIQSYLRKAAREAKVHTSWLHPEPAWEKTLDSFVAALLDPRVSRPFLEDFRRFQERVAFYGAWYGLAQTVLKIAAPGVPDVYQGSDLWDLRLVDPDNRHPVDYTRRANVLSDLRRRHASDPASLVRELAASWQDGRIKLYVLWRGLGLRRERGSLLARGDYLPARIDGVSSDSVCGFLRRLGSAWVLAAVPLRLVRRTAPGDPPVGARTWPRGRLILPAGAPARWRDAFTGVVLDADRRAGRRTLALAELFGSFPVALLGCD